MNKLVVNENSKVNIDDDNREILSDLLEIGRQIKEALGLKASPIQAISTTQIYIGNIVGNVALNSTNLVIYPKYMTDDSGIDIDKRVIVNKLLNRTIKCSASNLMSTVFFYRNNAIDDQSDFIDVLAKYFWAITVRTIQKSKICMYETKIEKVRTIKGKVLVQKQLAEPILDEKTWCKYKRMTNNNIFNQLLFWGCKYLSSLSSSFDIKRKLLNLSKEFPQNTDLLNKYTVSKIHVSRQFIEYEESINLIKNLYLHEQNKKEQIGIGNRICGYAINMERAFENMVCFYTQIASIACGYRHKSQANKQLATGSASEEFNYNVRPDDLISIGSSYLIMDAKYKTLTIQDKLKKKPSREDYYQMVSSCIAYDCSEAILIYPMTMGFPTMYWVTDNIVNGKKIIVRASAIDINKTDEELISQLIEIIKNTSLVKETSNG